MPETELARRARRSRLPFRGLPSLPARIAARTLVLVLVLAGTTAFAAAHKSVTLDVDGSVRSVTAFGRTVGDVLAANGVVVDERDLVVPAPEAAVPDGGTVVVRHGREVTVVVDGEERTVWTTARTVGEVLADLGLRGDLRSSASRSAPLGRGTLEVSTSKTLHVVVDGATQDVVTTAGTVGEALAEAGVVLGEHDTVSVPPRTAAVDGLAVVVTRVATEVRSETTTHAFEVVRKDDDGLTKGMEVVSVKGRNGTSVVTYEAQLVGGVEVGRRVLAEAVLEPAVDEVVRVGTATAPTMADVPPVSPGTARAIGLEMVLARGWSEAEFACLDKLWTKESNWRVNAENRSSGAYGIPQALPGSKMASAGDDWRTNPATQIAWGLGYIANRYDTPCGAWSFFQARNYY